MKEHGILFQPEMARAVLAGRKWVTRRTDLRWAKAKPGDVLWGRETFAVDRIYDTNAPSELPGNPEVVHYMADGPKPGHVGRTRVSIHMPRWASRIVRPIVSVRIESLHDITDEDAKAEGFPLPDGILAKVNGKPGRVHDFQPRAAFARYWDALNPDAPFWKSKAVEVVRIEFERTNPPTTEEVV